MSPHTEQHDTLLASLAAGDVADDDPRIERLAEECPVCRGIRDDLRELVPRLDDAAALEDEMLDAIDRSERDAATAAEDAELVDSFDDFVRGRLEADQATATPLVEPVGDRHTADPTADASSASQRHRAFHRRRSLALLAAAAVILVGVWLGPSLLDAPPKDDLRDTPLGFDEVTATTPLGETTSFARFEWTGDIATDASYVVVVNDATPAGERREVARSGDRYEAWWQPEDSASWPDHIRWQVIVYDSRKIPVARSAEVEAKRIARD